MCHWFKFNEATRAIHISQLISNQNCGLGISIKRQLIISVLFICHKISVLTFAKENNFILLLIILRKCDGAQKMHPPVHVSFPALLPANQMEVCGKH